MTTVKQINANKKNALLGGVKTPEGKAKIRSNAFKHGLRARELFLDLKNYSEESQCLESIQKGLVESLNPHDPLELLFIEQMAVAVFKQGRYEKLERHCFDDPVENFLGGSSLENPSPEQTKRKETMITLDDSIEKFSKYKTGIDSQFQKAFENLIRFRQSRAMGLFVKKGDFNGN